MSANLKLAPRSDDPMDLIPLADGASMLGLDSSTIRKRMAGTENLTIIRQGRNLFVIRSEVVAHRGKLIEDARRRNDPRKLVVVK